MPAKSVYVRRVQARAERTIARRNNAAGIMRVVSIIAAVALVALIALTLVPEAERLPRHLLARLIGCCRPAADDPPRSQGQGRTQTRCRGSRQAADHCERSQSGRCRGGRFPRGAPREGRLIDFLMDDLTAYGDAQVGAAARVVHEGCKAVLQEH